MNTEAAKFFKQEEDCVRFIGDDLKCFIPMRYKAKNMLIVDSMVTALGIFTMLINDSIQCGLQIFATIRIDPDSTYETTIDGEDFFVCELKKNNRLMTTLNIMQDNNVGYVAWTEMIASGHLPSYINYENIATLFDDMKEHTGKGTSVNHAAFEMLYAHLFRDADDPHVHYRYTDMKKPPVFINVRNVSYGPTSTQSRIIGSYADDGRNAALVNQAEENHEIEDFFR